MLLLNALTVLQKVIQSLPNFVSPYLRNILVQVILILIFEIIIIQCFNVFNLNCNSSNHLLFKTL